MENIKLAMFDTKSYDIDFFDQIKEHYDIEIKYFQPKLSLDTVALTQGFNAVCVFVNDEISKEVIAKLYSYGIKIIALRCSGYNNVDFQASFGKIVVVRVPAYSPYSVAEHALALMMSLNRKIHKAYNRTKEGNFALSGLLGYDFHGKTAGIIGTGKIGQVFIKILKGLGMQIFANDYMPNQDLAKDLGFQYCSLAEIYKNSDLISLHCPLTKETKHLINSETIKQMKDNVMLINTSRGGLIDTQALIDGLKNKKIGAAGLDVYEEEADYFFEDWSNKVLDDDLLARLISFNNVIVTSHQAFFTKEALVKIANTTMENLVAFKNNSYLENEICYQCPETKPCKKEKGKNCF